MGKLRVLVTGGSGGLGRYVAEEFQKAGHRVKVLRRPFRSEAYAPPARPPIYGWDFGAPVECDVADAWQVGRVLGALAPDVVAHLAGVSVVRADAADPAAVTRVNALGTHHLLEYAPPGCRFLLASSAAVYGETAGPAHESLPLFPSSAYGASKAAAEALVHAYTALGRVKGLSLRLVANAGAHFRHGLVRDILLKLRSDAPELELIGEAPGSRKPVAWAGDTARAFVHFAEVAPDNTAPLNICPDDAITVEEVANLCMEESGIHKPVRWLGWGVNWAGDVPLLRASNERAKRPHFHFRYGKSADAVRAAVRDILGGC